MRNGKSLSTQAGFIFKVKLEDKSRLCFLNSGLLEPRNIHEFKSGFLPQDRKCYAFCRHEDVREIIVACAGAAQQYSSIRGHIQMSTLADCFGALPICDIPDKHVQGTGREMSFAICDMSCVSSPKGAEVISMIHLQVEWTTAVERLGQEYQIHWNMWGEVLTVQLRSLQPTVVHSNCKRHYPGLDMTDTGQQILSSPQTLLSRDYAIYRTQAWTQGVRKLWPNATGPRALTMPTIKLTVGQESNRSCWMLFRKQKSSGSTLR